MLLGYVLTKAYIDLKFLGFDAYLDLVDPSVTSQGTDRNPLHSLWVFMRFLNIRSTIQPGYLRLLHLL